jgi:hypothetical protein
MQKAISIIKLIIGNVFVLILLLFLANTFCRYYLRSTVSSRADLPNYATNKSLAKKIFTDYARVTHEYSPFMGWKTLPYQGETLVIEQSGFRRVIPDNTNEAETIIKVGIFGGSTLWGEGASDEETIPSLIARQNPQYQVYNYGQLAYNSRQNLALLTNLYSSGDRLDIVIFYDGVNDAAFLCPDGISVPGHRMEPIFKLRVYASTKSMIIKALYKYFIQDIINYTNFIKVRYFDQQLQSEYLCYQNKNKIDAIAEGLLNNWQIASQIVSTNGGIFIGVLQPMAYRGNPRLDHLQELDPELGNSMNLVYDIILNKLNEEFNPITLNLVDAFDSNEYIYIDFCHVSPNGNHIIAEEITRFVSKNTIGDEILTLDD